MDDIETFSPGDEIYFINPKGNRDAAFINGRIEKHGKGPLKVADVKSAKSRRLVGHPQLLVVEKDGEHIKTSVDEEVDSLFSGYWFTKKPW